jgi:hypothetical protein
MKSLIQILNESADSWELKTLYKATLRASLESARPSVIWKPKLSLDGDAWCAMYGDNLQVGVSGFGRTPNDAMKSFDTAWLNMTPPKVTGGQE